MIGEFYKQTGYEYEDFVVQNMEVIMEQIRCLLNALDRALK